MLPRDGSTVPSMETVHMTLVPELTFLGMHVPLYVLVPVLPIFVRVTLMALAGRCMPTPKLSRKTTVYFIGMLCAVFTLVSVL